MQHRVEVLITEQEVRQRISQLAKEITEHYKHSNRRLIVIGLLRGSFIFMADLCREIALPHEIDFMTVSSYGKGMMSSGDVKIIKDLDEDIKGKEVLLIEDIIDTGNTLCKIREILQIRQPHSLAVCTLLDKPSRREVKVSADWVGFTVPDKFVVGYGIDYAQRYRHLPYIGNVVMLEE